MFASWLASTLSLRFIAIASHMHSSVNIRHLTILDFRDIYWFCCITEIIRTKLVVLLNTANYVNNKQQERWLSPTKRASAAKIN